MEAFPIIPIAVTVTFWGARLLVIDAAAATILWPHDAKSRLIGKDPEIGKD